jgi:hypothetical protein
MRPSTRDFLHFSQHAGRVALGFCFLPAAPYQSFGINQYGAANDTFEFLKANVFFFRRCQVKSSAFIFAVSCYGGALFILNAIGTAGRHGA